jgi:hypothetical protein
MCEHEERHLPFPRLLSSCQALFERRAMEEFLAAGEALLARSPSNADEIGLAGQEARGLVARLGDVSQVRAAGAGFQQSVQTCTAGQRVRGHHTAGQQKASAARPPQLPAILPTQRGWHP